MSLNSSHEIYPLPSRSKMLHTFLKSRSESYRPRALTPALRSSAVMSLSSFVSSLSNRSSGFSPRTRKASRVKREKKRCKKMFSIIALSSQAFLNSSKEMRALSGPIPTIFRMIFVSSSFSYKREVNSETSRRFRYPSLSPA